MWGLHTQADSIPTIPISLLHQLKRPDGNARSADELRDLCDIVVCNFCVAKKGGHASTQVVQQNEMPRGATCPDVSCRIAVFVANERRGIRGEHRDHDAAALSRPDVVAMFIDDLNYVLVGKQGIRPTRLDGDADISKLGAGVHVMKGRNTKLPHHAKAARFV